MLSDLMCLEERLAPERRRRAEEALAPARRHKPAAISPQPPAPARRRTWARDRHRPVTCWTCGEKRKALPRRKRKSLLFREMCRPCWRLRRLRVRMRRRLGRVAFLPRHVREARVPKPKEELPLSFIYDVPEDERGMPLPADDPMRDYAYFAKHQREIEKEARRKAWARKLAQDKAQAEAQKQTSQSPPAPRVPKKTDDDWPPGPRITRL